MSTNPNEIAVLDFGGQYAHLITNRIRRIGVHAVIKSHDSTAEELKDFAGLILSGGPQSVNAEEALLADPEIFELGIPILGICYGHQVVNKTLGGIVEPGQTKEYGKTKLNIDHRKGIFTDLDRLELTVWMSHWDEVTDIPTEFEVLAHTDINAFAAVGNLEKNIFGIQFHPEVTHTEQGMKILENFVNLTGAEKTWNTQQQLEDITNQVKDQVEKSGRKIFLLVSGGVDSVVAFALLNKVLGTEKVYGMLVDTGFMRKGEVEEVQEALTKLSYDNLHVYDAKQDFYNALEGVTDPEEKRAIIGKKFIEVQAKAVKELGLDPDHWMLGQGTIYPDTIESGATKHADKIKTHHNRVPEIQEMIDQGLVIEPLADLYKDEVRNLGEQLGLPHHLVWRHPFPGPGLAVRMLCNAEKIPHQELTDNGGKIVLPVKSVGVQGDARTYRHPAILEWQQNDDSKTFGQELEELEEQATQTINAEDEINRCLILLGASFEGKPETIVVPTATLTQSRVERLQRADAIITEVLHDMKLYNEVWQFPVVLVPMHFNSTGEESIVLRPVNSTDAMTAQVGILPWTFYQTVTKKILEDESLSAVFLDITNKPPGTIEWE